MLWVEVWGFFSRQTGGGYRGLCGTSRNRCSEDREHLKAWFKEAETGFPRECVYLPLLCKGLFIAALLLHCNYSLEDDHVSWFAVGTRVFDVVHKGL